MSGSVDRDEPEPDSEAPASARRSGRAHIFQVMTLSDDPRCGRLRNSKDIKIIINPRTAGQFSAAAELARNAGEK